MNLIEQRTESKEPEETLDTTAASNRLRITETRGSTSWVHTYEYTAATNTWTYTSPGNLSEQNLTEYLAHILGLKYPKEKIADYTQGLMYIDASYYQGSEVNRSEWKEVGCR